jgi:hypothetical protein
MTKRGENAVSSVFGCDSFVICKNGTFAIGKVEQRQRNCTARLRLKKFEEGENPPRQIPGETATSTAAEKGQQKLPDNRIWLGS